MRRLGVTWVVLALGLAAFAAPVHASKEIAPPKLAAKAWVVIDPLDGALLAAHAPHRHLPVASATKLMTAYVVLKKLRPKKILAAVPYKALAAESLLGLAAGEKLTVKDLLYALLLPSANDAAATLARGAAGSEGAFVAEMNRRAVVLGLDDTRYANPIGLDDPKNFSSASDLAELASLLRRNKLFSRIVATRSTVLRSGSTRRRISSRNTLLGSDPSVNGVKTGHTGKAGYVLVASAERNGTTLISAILGARSEAARDRETEKLLRYAFAQYRASTPVAEGQELASPSLDFRGDDLPLIAEREIRASARRGQSVETTIDAPDELSGDIEEGEPLGSVQVTVDGKVLARSPLVASRAVKAATTFQKASHRIGDPVILIPLGIFVIGVGLLLRRRRHSHKPGGAPTTPVPAAPLSPAVKPEPEAEKPKGPIVAEKPEGRTPDERRKMHDERMRKRREKADRKGGRQ